MSAITRISFLPNYIIIPVLCPRLVVSPFYQTILLYLSYVRDYSYLLSTKLYYYTCLMSAISRISFLPNYIIIPVLCPRLLVSPFYQTILLYLSYVRDYSYLLSTKLYYYTCLMSAITRISFLPNYIIIPV